MTKEQMRLMNEHRSLAQWLALEKSESMNDMESFPQVTMLALERAVKRYDRERDGDFGKFAKGVILKAINKHRKLNRDCIFVLTAEEEAESEEYFRSGKEVMEAELRSLGCII